MSIKMTVSILILLILTQRPKVQYMHDLSKTTICIHSYLFRVGKKTLKQQKN